MDPYGSCKSEWFLIGPHGYLLVLMGPGPYLS